MARVFISDKLPAEGLAVLERRGFDFEMTTGLSEDELCVALADGVEALIVRSGTTVTPKVIEAAKDLRVVGRAGVGIDNIDVEAATRRGVLVMNTPTGNIASAAEHAVALILACARNLTRGDGALHDGKWERSKLVGVEVSGKTLGIVGLGKVGALVAGLLRGFNMNILGFDPYCTEERAEQMGVTLSSLEGLLREADFVTLHTPLTDGTRGLINYERMKTMKSNARIINCARGGIVVESDLIRAIEEGVISGAGLDVFEQEPLPADSPLLAVPGIIVTPHLGASTEEAQLRVAEDIAAQISDYLDHDEIRNAVNVASVRDPELAPFQALAESLGQLIAQLDVGALKEVEITCVGEVAERDSRPVTVSVLKGLLRPALGKMVNLVNAQLLAQERGIRVKDSRDLRKETYSSLIRVRALGDKGERTVEGTLFDNKYPRFVRIDEFTVDFSPSQHLLIMFYPDRPGMVGRFGSVLGKHDINIAGMDVGRKGRGKQAVVILTLDEHVDPAVIEEMREAVEAQALYHVDFLEDKPVPVSV